MQVGANRSHLILIYYDSKRLKFKTINFSWGAIPLFAGQISGANPAIPGVFQNMFPLATSQVSFFLSNSGLQHRFFINFTIFFVCLSEVAAFQCSPCHASSGYDATGKIGFSMRSEYLFFPLALLPLIMARLWITKLYRLLDMLGGCMLGASLLQPMSRYFALDWWFYSLV